jgi:hypothetical protein
MFYNVTCAQELESLFAPSVFRWLTLYLETGFKRFKYVWSCFGTLAPDDNNDGESSSGNVEEEVSE